MKAKRIRMAARETEFNGHLGLIQFPPRGQIQDDLEKIKEPPECAALVADLMR
jgi:hypothetical protein